MYVYMEIIGKIVCHVMLSVLNFHLEQLDDHADMPNAPHQLLSIMDIARLTCRHIPKYQCNIYLYILNFPMYMYMEIVGNIFANVMMFVLNFHLEDLDDDVHMLTATHKLLSIMDIARPKCRHMAKYQVEVRYEKDNMLKC